MKFYGLPFSIILIFCFSIKSNAQYLQVAPKIENNNHSNNQIVTDKDIYLKTTHKKIVFNKFINNLILINKYDGILECYDTDNNLKWSFIPKNQTNISNGRNQFYYEDGVIYTAYLTGEIFALSAIDGSIFWEGKIGLDNDVLHTTSQSLKPNNNTIILSSRNNRNIYSINASTGKLVWNYLLPSPHNYMPSLTLGENIYTTNDPFINVFNASKGTLLVQKNFNSNLSKLVSDGENIILYKENDKKIIALNPNDLSLIWEQPGNEDLNNIQKKIFTLKKHVYFASKSFAKNSNPKNSSIYSLHSSTGKIIWQKNIEGTIEYLVTLNDKIFGYTDNKKLFSLSLKGVSENNKDLNYQPTSNLILNNDGIFYYSKEGLIKLALNESKEEILIPFNGTSDNLRYDSQILFIN